MSFGFFYTRFPLPDPGRQSAPVQTAQPLGIYARATIYDSIAHVSITQQYKNPDTENSIQAVYCFPLQDGAAIHAFEAVVNETKRIVGRVQETEAARSAYQEAVKDERFASLFEAVTPDVFQTSVGNIPPSGTVAITFQYVTELKHDAEADQIQFILPTAVAPSFPSGSLFGDTGGHSVWDGSRGISIDIACKMASPIVSVESPSHHVTVYLQNGGDDSDDGDVVEGTAASMFDPTRIRITYATGRTVLGKDFVLKIRAKDLNKPRCLIEAGPSSHCMMLTLVPRFALNPLFSELIFVVDRALMIGAQSSQIRWALHLLVASLPKHCFFNIVGFGSAYRFLFAQSVERNAQSVEVASKYAEEVVSPDWGKKDLNAALGAVFKARRCEMPTQVFVLTDGKLDHDNMEMALRSIRENVDPAHTPLRSPKSRDSTSVSVSDFVRVFSMGIGNGVSQHPVEAMARAGKGFAEFVTDWDSMQKKIVKQLECAVLPPMADCEIVWLDKKVGGNGSESPQSPDDFEVIPAAHEVPERSDEHQQRQQTKQQQKSSSTSTQKPISLFSNKSEPTPPSPTPLPELVSDIQSAPRQVPPLYPGSRFVVYCIIKNSALIDDTTGRLRIPENVVIRGMTPDGPVELTVPVTPTQFKRPRHHYRQQSSPTDLVLHTLAARKLIQDLEETHHTLIKDNVALFSGTLRPQPYLAVKSEIIRLGLLYNLTSKHTSFVAVEEEVEDEEEDEGDGSGGDEEEIEGAAGRRKSKKEGRNADKGKKQKKDESKSTTTIIHHHHHYHPYNAFVSNQGPLPDPNPQGGFSFQSFPRLHSRLPPIRQASTESLFSGPFVPVPLSASFGAAPANATTASAPVSGFTFGGSAPQAPTGQQQTVPLFGSNTSAAFGQPATGFGQSATSGGLFGSKSPTATFGQSTTFTLGSAASEGSTCASNAQQPAVQGGGGFGSSLFGSSTANTSAPVATFGSGFGAGRTNATATNNTTSTSFGGFGASAGTETATTTTNTTSASSGFLGLAGGSGFVMGSYTKRAAAPIGFGSRTGAGTTNATAAGSSTSTSFGGFGSGSGTAPVSTTTTTTAASSGSGGALGSNLFGSSETTATGPFAMFGSDFGASKTKETATASSTTTSFGGFGSRAEAGSTNTSAAGSGSSSEVRSGSLFGSSTTSTAPPVATFGSGLGAATKKEKEPAGGEGASSTSTSLGGSGNGAGTGMATGTSAGTTTTKTKTALLSGVESVTTTSTNADSSERVVSRSGTTARTDNRTTATAETTGTGQSSSSSEFIPPQERPSQSLTSFLRALSQRDYVYLESKLSKHINVSNETLDATVAHVAENYPPTVPNPSTLEPLDVAVAHLWLTLIWLSALEIKYPHEKRWWEEKARCAEKYLRDTSGRLYGEEEIAEVLDKLKAEAREIVRGFGVTKVEEGVSAHVGEGEAIGAQKRGYGLFDDQDDI
ncbi:hypothetical protein HK102_007493 [Quaeritorhiza haematococci]|nr:hypothetical protein HK102_007493 [Quaeritorhiza haematococci]